MRNLSISEIDEAAFSPDESPLTSTTFDASTGDVIYTLGPSASKPVVELRRRTGQVPNTQNGGLMITSWDAPCPLPDLACDEVLSLQYFHESSSICVIFAGGDIVLVREKPSPDQERIEIVGSIDVGISAAKWSWNASLLALVTRAGSFVLMSQQLDPVNEISLQEADLSLSKHVSVGWGKKETQFQGKRAKAMKDPTMPDFVDEGKPSPNEDGKTVISWRGDGAFVAVNSNLSTSRRVIRVYSAEGMLDSVSEPVDGLESALSWRPYGNLIASVRRLPSSLQVLFFERNGLRHGELHLPISEDEMRSFGTHVSLHWNCDSSILAMKFNDRAYFWTMGNYHYYLKQDIRLPELQSIDWHPTDPLRLNISSQTCLRSVSMDFQVLRGSTFTPFDYGLVAVIDGKTLKLTPLKHVNIPPPVAFIDVSVDDNIVACAISRTCQRIAILTHDHIYLCQVEMLQATRKANDPSIRHSNKFHMEKLKLPSSMAQYLQIVIQDDDKIFLLSPSRSISGSIDEQYSAICHESLWVTTIRSQDEVRLSLVSVLPDTRQLILDREKETIYTRKDGGIYQLSAGTSDLLSEASSVCEIFHIRKNGEMQVYTVSLSKAQQLAISGGKIDITISNVTSFVISDSHIIYTTSNHLLKFIHLDDPTSMSVPDDTPEIDERCRAIERGALIVTVIPSSYAVILQMPRGNLETIYPRILVLSGIRKHIRDLQYRKAFLACQVHQVDLNILYDFDSMLFLSNVPLFIDQLKKPGRVDEFLQKLKDEDVTKTLYRDTSLNHGTLPVNPTAQVGSDKINKVCDSIITDLQSRDTAYQPNIITAYVCKRPPDLISALTLVSNLRQSSSEEADLAIAHLCFLTDTNRLYDTALALYDLELTLLVAQNAQRDPREYMPFLQSLQALPVLRRQYKIDNHLKKYAKALVSLHSLEEHDEMEAYTVKHSLYTDAINLYKYTPAHRDKITRLYAGHLANNSKHAHAATLYESLSNYESAFPLYALAHQWREALACACLVPVSAPQLETLAKSLAATCAEETRDYRSAATIHLEYLDDALGAAELLCKGSYFAEATRILSHPGHAKIQSVTPTDQLSQIVDVALTRKFGEILELIADCQTQLSSQVPRIEELRIKKAEDPFAFFGGEGNVPDGVDIPDNISLAATDASTLGGQSMFTRYAGGAGGSQVSTKFGGTVRSDVSRKTSKTKRKEERKRAQGKKGSVYEEEYLVASVGRLIERVNGVHEEVRRLVSGLERRGLSEQAGKVEEVMLGIQSGCEDAKKRVWKGVSEGDVEGQNGVVNGVTEQIEDQYRPTGADGVLFESQVEGQGERQQKIPQVKSWKSSTT